MRFPTHQNAEYIDSNGFFVGNHQIDLRSEQNIYLRHYKGFEIF